MKIEEMTRKMNQLNDEIQELLKNSGYAQESDFYPDEYQTRRKTVTDEDGYSEDVADLTADEWQLIHEYERILSRLDDIADRLDYLSKPITHEGQAYKTENDKFAVDGCEFHCGYRVEYQRYDKEHDCNYWITDRVEHSSEKGGYYFYSSGKTLTEGMNVRIRW